jgi:hypothetical protein
VTTFYTQIGALFAEASVTVAAIRVSQGLPPLVPSGAILIGQEWLAFEHDSPRIVAVPTRTEYSGAIPTNPPTVGQGTPPNKYVFSRYMDFDVHIWGEPDPTGVDPLYDFNSTLELEREFLYAMQASMSIPISVPKSGEWRQPQDVQRRGRLLVLQLRIWTPVVAPPYTILPYSQTPNDGGVERDVSVQINPPTGATVGPIIIPS